VRRVTREHDDSQTVPQRHYTDDEWAFVVPYLTLMNEQEHGIRLEGVKLSAAKQGFGCCPGGVVERNLGWIARFRRLARDDEHLPETLAGLHFLVFAILMLVQAPSLLQSA
jgi:hypothetical protein